MTNPTSLLRVAAALCTSRFTVSASEPPAGLACVGEACALSMVQKETAVLQVERKSVQISGGVGSSKCPCIGIDFEHGQQNVQSVGQEVWFPAGVGSHCQAWEENVHPSCTGDHPPAWCKREWCFVDPCNCELDEAAPKSAYFPKAKYQGRDVHYSYATCGGKEMWGMPQREMPKFPVGDDSKCGNRDDEASCTDLKYCLWDTVSCRPKQAVTQCQAQETPSLLFGNQSCPCIGIDGLEGTVKGVVLKYGERSFPADIGGTCHAWDANLQDGNPGCESDGTQPHWCLVKFCYVDPCTCVLPIPPKRSNYFAGAKAGGKPLYFSYATCGNEYEWELDDYSKYADECINHNFPETCAAKGDACFWQDGRCLDKDLEPFCAAPH